MLTTWSDSDWKRRLAERLEPLLKSPRLEAEISTYQGVPFALFVYPPTAELELRRDARMLATRIEQQTSRKVAQISMAELLWEAIRCAHPPDGKPLFEAERALAHAEVEDRLEQTAEHIRSIVSEMSPIPKMIQARVAGLHPERHIVFLLRVGALYPAYRAHALLENLMYEVRIPTVLFYPGSRSGTNSLRFMDSLDALHSYRHKIL
ncbi:MAG: BREX protein BrxB domain-containing protein [Candidatus Rokuibacteriota bacterium]